jgi:hypothetical protein
MIYKDADRVAEDAREAIAAAFIYQALVHINRAEKIPSQYIVE